MKALEPTRPLKAALPGPLTFAASIDAADVGATAVLDALEAAVPDHVEVVSRDLAAEDPELVDEAVDRLVALIEESSS